MSTNLEPHEQLDEIDLRTNDDGTVQVRLLKWNKHSRLDEVTVKYRTPVGDVKSETMPWPQANHNSYKFIRLINETPYTLRTADQINEDDDLWLDADPSTWDLALPESTLLPDRVPVPKNSVGFEFVKLAMYPLTVFGMLGALLEKDEEYVGFGEEPYHSTYLEDEKHHAKTISAVKSAMYTFLWMMLLILALL